MAKRDYRTGRTGKLPQRPRQHIDGECAEVAVRGAFPPEWIVRKQTPDYGIDFTVEKVVGRIVTGKTIAVQVKGVATAKGKSNTISLCGIKQKTINYWHNRTERVMLAVYVKDEKKVFWMWADEIPMPTSETTTVTVCVPRTQQLEHTDWSNLRFQKLDRQGLTLAQICNMAAQVGRVCPSAGRKIQDGQREVLKSMLLRDDLRIKFFAHIHAIDPKASAGLSWEVFEDECRNWIESRSPAGNERYRAFVHEELDKVIGLTGPTHVKND